MAANMSISDLLSSLTAGKRPDVFLSVTPGVGLEMIQVDYNAGELQSYALRPIQYNESLRELTDMEGFKTAVSEMFTELNINPKCNITLNLPTVLFGSMDISLMLGEENITGAATSEVEQSYVFKRHDPLVKWFDSNTGSAENRKIFYSAVQQSTSYKLPKSLKTVNLTDTKNIKEEAFANCDYIQNVTLNEGIEKIQAGAFKNCDMLKSIIIPEGVTTIGEFAFYENTSMILVSIPKSTIVIGKSAFQNCSEVYIFYGGSMHGLTMDISTWNTNSRPIMWNKRLV